MPTYFISRHPGAVEWARRKGIDADIVAHLDPSIVQPGDLIIGTLPVHVVAAVNARGGRYLHLEINVPSHLRGTDLSADDMEKMGATLTGFRVERIEQ